LLDVCKQIDPQVKVDPLPKALVNKVLRLNGQKDKNFISYVFEFIVPQYEAALWCTKNYDKINAVIEQIKQERLLLIMQSDCVRRANDDLSRSFARALNEFKKQRHWRTQNNLIDIDQAPEE